MMEQQPANERLRAELANVAIGPTVLISNGLGAAGPCQAVTDWLEAAALPPLPAVSASPPRAGDPAVAERPGQRRDAEHDLLANVYRDPTRHTVSFLLDDLTANTVIYAVRLLAADAEAHAREVRLVAETMPPDSYGAANRQAVAWRQERIARRLRLLESNYRDMTAAFGGP
jgi:hypothetical protein